MEIPTHFRRCHICGEVTMVIGKLVDRCGACCKPMAPFFYFDEKAVSVLRDNAIRPEVKVGQLPPIRGLTAFWETDNQ